jgi:hypothetical protein
VAVICVPVNKVEPNFAGGMWFGPIANPTWTGVPPGSVEAQSADGCGGGVVSGGGGVVSTGGSGVVVSGGGVVVVSGGVESLGDSFDSNEEPLLHAIAVSDTNSTLPSSLTDLRACEKTCPSPGLTAAPLQ